MNQEVVSIAFEYSYLHDDWVTPLSEALEGVSVEEALRKVGETSIWMIVLHLAVWNENIVERIETGEKTHPTEGAWPALPAVQDEAAWETAKRRLWDSLELVKGLIEHTPIETIDSRAYGLGDLFCRFNHMAYHVGQITKMREVFSGQYVLDSV